MPLYEYRCDACARAFEVLTPFADRDLQVCPTCESKQIRVVASSFAVAGAPATRGDAGGGSCCGGSCGCGGGRGATDD